MAEAFICDALRTAVGRYGRPVTRLEFAIADVDAAQLNEISPAKRWRCCAGWRFSDDGEQVVIEELHRAAAAARCASASARSRACGGERA